MSGNGVAHALFWILVGMMLLALIEGWAHARLERAREQRANAELEARIRARYAERHPMRDRQDGAR